MEKGSKGMLLPERRQEADSWRSGGLCDIQGNRGRYGLPADGRLALQYEMLRSSFDRGVEKIGRFVKIYYDVVEVLYYSKSGLLNLKVTLMG